MGYSARGGVTVGNDIATDLWGNVCITGSFRDTADFDPSLNEYNLSSASNQGDIFVAKYDPSGQLLWAFSFGDTLSDTGKSIAIDTLGNIYITGGFRGSVDFDSGPNSFILNTSAPDHEDIFILKITPDGSFDWAKTVNGKDAKVFCNDIAVSGGGEVYITGSYYGSVDFDPNFDEFYLSSILASNDIYILKLDINGNFIWAKTIGGEGYQSSRSIALDSVNNVYTTGTFDDNVDFDPGTNQHILSATGLDNLFISKLNSEGDFIWAKDINSTSAIPKDIVIDNIENVHLTGRYSETTDFDPSTNIYNLSSSGLTDGFILKLNHNGDFVWAKSFGADGHDNGEGISIDGSNNLFITGRFRNTVDFDPGLDSFYLVGDSNADIFILNLSSEGEFVQAMSFPDIGVFSEGNSIVVDDQNNIYTTGRFSSTIDFDPGIGVYELTTENSAAGFILKMSQPSCNVSPVITSTNNSFTTCLGDSLALSADMSSSVTDISYLWNTSDTTQVISILADSNSIYSVSVTYNSSFTNCVTTDSVMVFVNPISDTTYLEWTTCDSMEVGILELNFSDQNGCDSIVLEVTTLSLAPEIPIILLDVVIQENAPPFQVTASEVQNATSYFWTVPLGVQILSGINTNTITVDWNGINIGGSICVYAINDCGNSPTSCMEVTVDIIDGLSTLNKDEYFVFPNPANDFILVVPADEQTYEVELLDILGQIVFPSSKYIGQARISVRNLPTGIYWLKIYSSENDSSKPQWGRVEVIH